MSAEDTVRMLQVQDPDARPLGPRQWRRRAARVAWVRERVAALRAAHRAMDRRCGGAVDRLSEPDFERLVAAEQAKVDAIRAELQAVVERDEWPRHLYFGGE